LDALQTHPIYRSIVSALGHVSRFGRNTLIGHQPEVNVVQFRKQLVELDCWLLGHSAKHRQQYVWVLHYVLLSYRFQLENLPAFAL
jgi:hypothetical protein